MRNFTGLPPTVGFKKTQVRLVLLVLVVVAGAFLLLQSCAYLYPIQDHDVQAIVATPRKTRRLESSAKGEASKEDSDHSNEPKIPHLLVFTYKDDILKTKEPKAIYENIKKTIESFRTAWDEPDAPVKLYTDEQCIEMLNVVEPQLVPYFKKEKYGWNKADLCRIVVLYLHGGYYFDSDMEVITPPLLPPDTTFATVIQPRRKDFFQSFMASNPSNPILLRALKNMLAVYNGQLDVNKLLGTETLKWAYDAVPYTKRGKVFLLEEIFLEPHRYPDLPRQKGYGCCCNFVVHNPELEIVHFYSRMVGPLERCSKTPVDW
mmetsp:Transcript_20644/g.25536  ORF Transcript_20644/g.25536 Transcript_20644/m.25536 type:complete len:318 (-) Transcript_20644:248-1201(-)